MTELSLLINYIYSYIQGFTRFKMTTDVLVVKRALDGCLHCETRLNREIYDRWRIKIRMERVKRC